MSITEAVIEKMNALPPDKQERVLEFVQSISQPAPASVKNGQPHEWLDIAMNAHLQGPADWSEHLDDYLYGNKTNG